VVETVQEYHNKMLVSLVGDSLDGERHSSGNYRNKHKIMITMVRATKRRKCLVLGGCDREETNLSGKQRCSNGRMAELRVRELVGEGGREREKEKENEREKYLLSAWFLQSEQFVQRPCLSLRGVTMTFMTSFYWALGNIKDCGYTQKKKM
jgi:hypothetical protein